MPTENTNHGIGTEKPSRQDDSASCHKWAFVITHSELAQGHTEGLTTVAETEIMYGTNNVEYHLPRLI